MQLTDLDPRGRLPLFRINDEVWIVNRKEKTCIRTHVLALLCELANNGGCKQHSLFFTEYRLSVYNPNINGLSLLFDPDDVYATEKIARQSLEEPLNIVIKIRQESVLQNRNIDSCTLSRSCPRVYAMKKILLKCRNTNRTITAREKQQISSILSKDCPIPIEKRPKEIGLILEQLGIQ